MSCTLEGLPNEVLHKIFGFVPSSTAMNLPIVCRHFNEICADWTVWRDILRNSNNFHDNGILETSISKTDWLSYVQADKISTELRTIALLSDQTLSWLPQLTVLKRGFFI
jgi:hypothetical protein